MLNARMIDPETALLAGVKIHPYLTNSVSRDVEIEMLRLHQSIETLLPNRPSKIIQFMGPEGGEGTTAIVNAFGDVVARRIGKSVISIDVEKMESEQAVARVTGRRLPPVISGGGSTGAKLPVPANARGSQVAALDRRDGRTAGEVLYQRGTLSSYWSRLGAATDLILLDTPAAKRSASGLAAARRRRTAWSW